MIRRHTAIAILSALALILPQIACADGGYFGEPGTVAISSDQRAIIIRNGDETSMTFSTGYTGEGGDFSWIIPTPVPPQPWDVAEPGDAGERAFDILEGYTAPVATRTVGCFPAGVEVLTAEGPRPIESILPGEEVRSYSVVGGEWVYSEVRRCLTHQYSGDMVTISLGSIEIRATGNHPFLVLEGQRLEARPAPRDVPASEHDTGGIGQWVEARDLRPGDMLMEADSARVLVTAVSACAVSMEVYNLEVAGTHTYAVHRRGILVHNKAAAEDPSARRDLVTVYSTISLEHFDVSILGSATGTPLLAWLRRNNYTVDSRAEAVLDTYARKGWAFVAVKLNPSARRHYRNEFLPPLTLRFSHDELVFPLDISSVSTTESVRLTLYVLAESTVNSTNFATEQVEDCVVLDPVVPDLHLEACIQNMASEQPTGRCLVSLFAGELEPSAEDLLVLESLMHDPFAVGPPIYVTRLEGRISPEAMSEDVVLQLHNDPQEVATELWAVGPWWTDDVIELADTPGITELMRAVVDQTNPTRVEETLQVHAGTGTRNLSGSGSATWWSGEVPDEVDARDALGNTALMYAARYNRNPEAISLLLQSGARVNLQNLTGWSAVFFAAENPNPAVLAALLDAGADIDHQDEAGKSALVYLAEWGRVEAIRNLLEFQPNLNTLDTRGRSALTYAALGGHVGIMELLLRAGADANARSPGQLPALMAVVDSLSVANKTQVISTLLEAGADVNTRNEEGQTALLLEIGPYVPPDPVVVSMLLEAGSDLEAANENGCTPLLMAAIEGHVSIARMLLEAGANIEARGSRFSSFADYTPLMWAAHEVNPEMVQLLVDAGADVNAEDEDGRTVLMAAVYSGSAAAHPRRPEVVTILLNAGADVNERDGYGNTALTWARRGRETEVLRILRDARADQ
jgi:ankyrin repeat protein